MITELAEKNIFPIESQSTMGQVPSWLDAIHDFIVDELILSHQD